SILPASEKQEVEQYPKKLNKLFETRNSLVHFKEDYIPLTEIDGELIEQIHHDPEKLFELISSLKETVLIQELKNDKITAHISTIREIASMIPKKINKILGIKTSKHSF
ncbi:hypothetical protein LCGC14_2746820, partial [marine sediment metagenome]